MNVRPITLKWSPQGKGEIAGTALGTYQIQPNGDYWVPVLNAQPFAPFYNDAEMAKIAASLAQALYGGPLFSLTWEQEDEGLWAATAINTRWEVIQSTGPVKGWFVMRDEQVALTACTSAEMAKNSCQTHLTVLWYSLTEQVA